MGISKITRNFQVTIPHDVRAVKHFKVGDKVLFVVDGERVDIVKMDKEAMEAAAGLWKDMKEDGVTYTKRLRRGWKKRQLRWPL